MVGKNWIRTDIGDYDNPRFDDPHYVAGLLPDIKTESTTASGLPVFYKTKRILTLKSSKALHLAIT